MPFQVYLCKHVLLYSNEGSVEPNAQCNQQERKRTAPGPHCYNSCFHLIVM